MLNANPTIATPWLASKDGQRVAPVDAGHNGRPEVAVDRRAEVVKSLTQ